MANDSLQFGAAPTVAQWPELAPSRLHETVAAAGPDGRARPCRKYRRRAVSTYAPTRRCAPAESAGE
jgi:hypothetical protein